MSDTMEVEKMEGFRKLVIGYMPCGFGVGMPIQRNRSPNVWNAGLRQMSAIHYVAWFCRLFALLKNFSYHTRDL